MSMLGYHRDPWGAQAEFWDVVKRDAALPVALPRSIPDDPDFRRHIPLEYRLDAKAIVGDLSVDLQSGKSLHEWVERAHWGLAATEIFAEGIAAASTLVAGLAIAGPFLAAAGLFMSLGAGYQAAAEELAKDWSARGFSQGAVLGADHRRPADVIDYFANTSITNVFFDAGVTVARANYRLGLVAGYVQGRMLTENQRRIFWRDLGHRIGDQSYRGPTQRWGRAQWLDWYVSVAATFRRYHLT